MMSPKQVAIFGATGATGRELVHQALALGYTVTAYVRDESRLGMQHPALRVVSGDVTDAARVSAALAGQDGVLVALGPRRGRAPDVLTRGFRNIIAAARQHDVRRVVAVSEAGTKAVGDRKRLADQVVSALARLLGRRDAAAKEDQLRLFEESDLDWTLIRPPRLNDGPRSGTAKVEAHRLTGTPMVSRADLAEAMLRELEQCRFVRQAPFISG